MAKWAPLRSDVMDALATEILHNYRRGRAIVAVDGRNATETAAFADDLVAAVRQAGHVASHAVLALELDVAAVVSEFRESYQNDELLVVSGTMLHSPALVPYWNLSIWLEGMGAAEGPEQANYEATVRPRALATAIVSIADPAHPRRIFADSC